MTSTNYLGLITFNANGLVVADYKQVRQALTEQFKLIYGSDIDVSSTTVDGQYIEALSLVVNNMLQATKTMYSNLDVGTATGKYLDTLCALTNVVRKSATKSSVYVNISGLIPNTLYGVGNELMLIDKGNVVWACEPFTTDSQGEGYTLALCEDFGPVKAELGWIHSTLEMMAGVTIDMSSSATLGSFRESDSQLRARRDSSLSMRSSSVLEGLNSALLNVAGIDDVRIYNNDSANTITAKDSATIKKNDIYVILSKRENVEILDEVIGSIIYEKKTPGVHTATAGNFGTAQSYNYPTTIGLTQTVNWKYASTISPEIQVTVTPSDYFVGSGVGDSHQGSTGEVIAESIIEFMKELRLSEDARHIDLQSVAQFADPKYRGVSTYSVKSVKIDGLEADYINPDARFGYTNVAITGTVLTDIIITIT